jgi:hypothetical protein
MVLIVRCWCRRFPSDRRPVRSARVRARHEPLGVGINLQPNAVRELYDLGITEAELDEIGVPAQEWALVGLNGNDIYSETRGRLAGYHWPQYAVHRGHLQTPSSCRSV